MVAVKTTPATRRTGIIATLLMLGAVSGCGRASIDTTSATSAATDARVDAPVEVDLRLVAFKPERLTLKPGATARWTQRDPGSHTITSGTVEQAAGGVEAHPDGRFESGGLATDATFEHTFGEPGTYEYFCAIHPATMRGVVEVA